MLSILQKIQTLEAGVLTCLQNKPQWLSFTSGRLFGRQLLPTCQDSEAQLGPRAAAGARDLPANIQPKFPWRSPNLYCWAVQKSEAVSQHLRWNHFTMSLTNGRTWYINKTSFCIFLPFGYILETRNLQIPSDLCSDCLQHPASSMPSYRVEDRLEGP